MTLVDESTRREESSGGETVEQTAGDDSKNELSFFQRICCCCSSSSTKEPPVQLIRSGSLTYQQGQAASSAPVISAANGSVDDEDINLELRHGGHGAHGAKNQQHHLPVTREEPGEGDSINMNDFLMEDVLKRAHTEEDRTEHIEEEAVSISNDVVQEVDEIELKNTFRAKRSNDEVPRLKGRSGISKSVESVSIHSDEGEGEGDGEDDRKMSVIEFIRSEAEANDLHRISHEQQEKLSEATHSEITDSEGEEELSEVGHKLSVQNGISSNTTARLDRHSADQQRVVEFKELSSSDDSEEDEIMIIRKENEVDDEEAQELSPSPPPPLPKIPPPRLSSPEMMSPIPPPRSPRVSKMYENADLDSEDDSEEVVKPVSTSGLSKMQPVVFAPSPNAQQREEMDTSLASDLSEDVILKSRSSSASSIASSSSSSTSLPSEASEASDSGAEKENNIAVTRISVKSDGRAEIHSPRSPVRVTLDVDRQDLTDDDFSEKLI